MPKRKDIKSILVIGSGPIVIGQAAEFDYAGTQACLSLKEEGYRVILVNSNPATIMTDTEIADVVYIEPLTLEFVSRIIRKERPDALLPTLGGQTGLNMAVELADSGILDECGVEILGTKLSAIQQAEDRDLFRNLMNELNEPVPDSEIIHNLDEAYKFVEEIGYPVIVRPAFTLGGTGGGICHNEEELIEIVTSGLKYSPVTQCLLEKSIAGFKEIEYEVMRDSNDNAIVVCSMENVDPVGVHTGDSIVVALTARTHSGPRSGTQRSQSSQSRSLAHVPTRPPGVSGGCARPAPRRGFTCASLGWLSQSGGTCRRPRRATESRHGGAVVVVGEVAQALVAFTIEFDNEFEHRMDHHTTQPVKSGQSVKSGSPGVGPWLTSQVMWANVMQSVPTAGIAVGDLHARPRTARDSLAGLQRWGYVVVAPDAVARRCRGKVVRLTPKGQGARAEYHRILDATEQHWRTRFGAA